MSTSLGAFFTRIRTVFIFKRECICAHREDKVHQILTSRHPLPAWGALRCRPPASRGHRLLWVPRSAPLSTRKSRPGRKSHAGASRKMAASKTAGAAPGVGFPRRMARRKRGAGRGPGGGRDGALKRLKLAVEEFVQATSKGETPGGCEGPAVQGRRRPGGRKSRRELRKEKRHLRKARRLQRTAGPRQGPGSGGGAGGESGPRAEAEQRKGGRPAPRASEGLPPPPAQASLVRAPAPPAPARRPPGRTTAPAAAAAAARKRALLAANEEEDREIRKLERCLGLNKRRKKGDGSSVPLSFARDGLDYILGALASGRNSGLYESSGEEEEEEAGQTAPESDVESDPEDDREEEDVGEESEGELGAQSEDEEGEEDEEEDMEAGEDDQEEEERKAGGAEGRAEEKGRKKRVRFAEDGERSENASKDVSTTDQVCFSILRLSVLFLLSARPFHSFSLFVFIC